MLVGTGDHGDPIADPEAMDWNPVLGPAPGVDGLTLAFGFSGHGFKLAPAVGLTLAQQILGQDMDVDIGAYGLERFETGKLFIGAYTVTDALGVRVSGSPLGFIAWLFLISGLPLLAYARVARPGALGPYARAHWKPALAGGLMCALAYGLVIWALSLGAMASVSALRETSVVFAVLIGWILLGEPFGRRRIGAAMPVGLGIAIMQLAG